MFVFKAGERLLPGIRFLMLRSGSSEEHFLEIEPDVRPALHRRFLSEGEKRRKR